MLEQKIIKLDEKVSKLDEKVLKFKYLKNARTKNH